MEITTKSLPKTPVKLREKKFKNIYIFVVVVEQHFIFRARKKPYKTPPVF